MKGIDKLFYNVILGSFLVIILSLIFFIVTNDFSFKTIHDSFLGFAGTLGGAFLGAWLAGRYAIKAATITINESKLWNYEELRRLLIIHKRNFYSVYNHSNLIALGDLGEEDLNFTVRDISYHTNVISKNFDLRSIPTDFYKDIKMITSAVDSLNHYAFLYNKMLDDKILYDKEIVLRLNESYKKMLDRLFKDLKL
ncbi:hypothetical protein MUB24_06230 [Lederbergia sp. NSJ-179]|uniref:hypothetical protein n=1 Tax=Lederbergia sp. NSJ-179 TaxID=2931402 RepID=UPI001FD499AE|nr:hypothetical protein [Lederbergia sp. NSJ-179]MCJ7840524.1 hypothetical protein [Lederbergia sp. NSJ-179]